MGDDGDEGCSCPLEKDVELRPTFADHVVG